MSLKKVTVCIALFLGQSQAAQAAAADPKGKNKAPKGGPNPEQLNAELNEIRSFKAQGWILIGYP